MDWILTLTDREGLAYLRIVAALAVDIRSGRLLRGQQLPTHRALAKALRIDLTTVTRPNIVDSDLEQRRLAAELNTVDETVGLSYGLQVVRLCCDRQSTCGNDGNGAVVCSTSALCELSLWQSERR